MTEWKGEKSPLLAVQDWQAVSLLPPHRACPKRARETFVQILRKALLIDGHAAYCVDGQIVAGHPEAEQTLFGAQQRVAHNFRRRSIVAAEPDQFPDCPLTPNGEEIAIIIHQKFLVCKKIVVLRGGHWPGQVLASTVYPQGLGARL